jgi:hypothetical protein
MAVLPTPGSPIRAGLFLVRRARIWITRSISFRRPMTGSSLLPVGQGREVGTQLIDGGGRTGSLTARSRNGRPLQEVMDLVSHLLGWGAEPSQNIHRHALTFPHQAEQQVFGANVVMPQLAGLIHGQLNHALGTGGKRRLGIDPPASLTDSPLNGDPHLLCADIQALQHAQGDAPLFRHQAQQDMLGANVAVIQAPGLLLRCRQHAPGTFGETIKVVSHDVILTLCLESVIPIPLYPSRQREWVSLVT